MSKTPAAPSADDLHDAAMALEQIHPDHLDFAAFQRVAAWLHQKSDAKALREAAAARRKAPAPRIWPQQA